MTPIAKKRVFNLLRALICIAALWFVIRGVTWHDRLVLADGRVLAGDVSDEPGAIFVQTPAGETLQFSENEVARGEDGEVLIQRGLRRAWRVADKRLLLLAALVHFPVAFPLAMRFKWLLSAQGIRVSFIECLKLTFAGNFLNFVTPLGSHAGDAFKAYFASLHTERKTEAVTTVVLDRLVGLSTLLLAATLLTLLAPGDRLVILRPYVLGFLGVAGLAALLYFSPLSRKYRLPDAWLERVPALRYVRRIDLAARKLAGRGKILAGAVLLTLLLQVLALSAYFIVAVAVGLGASLGRYFEYFAYFYAGTLVQALPGPPQGLGTVELTYRYFFSPYASPSQIVCMALAIRVIVLICALPGLLITLTGAYRPKRALLSEPTLESIG
jgi:uncharacterized protein (TIRG00374 family)